MDKRAIERFAVWARRELMERVTRRAARFGITAEADTHIAGLRSVGSTLFSETEAAQRDALVQRILEKGFAFVIEEVAYTWFNRFCALRFMEVNDYLPTHLRVFTNAAGEFKPQILAEALSLALPAEERTRLLQAMQEGAADEVIFKQLLIWQCNDLGTCLPGMFERIGDYTELLFPDNILRHDSVIARLISDIPEEDWKDAVQIIGWLYQYYNTEPKNRVININKSVVSKEDIPYATQLFTPDWIVRYIVDNAVGNAWAEAHPSSNAVQSLTYRIATASESSLHPVQTPEELTVFDPCMGSGHFLVYAFEVLLGIYREQGYSERDAAQLIIQRNLFGLDIDPRATQLAYFALMMKARAHDRRFLTRGIQAQVYTTYDSSAVHPETWAAFFDGDVLLHGQMPLLKDAFADAGQLGSLIRIPDTLHTDLLSDKAAGLNVGDEQQKTLKSLIGAADLLSRRYMAVVTNPPYLNKYNKELKAYLTANFKEYASDLFSVFIYRNFDFCQEGGYSGMMTPFVWMFIKSYEQLRRYIIGEKHIHTLIQFEYSAFEEATVPICTFVFRNIRSEAAGTYFRLSDFKGGMEVQREKLETALATNADYVYSSNTSCFSAIPGSPIAYWVSDAIIQSYQHKTLGETIVPRHGLATSDNGRFLRLWYEVSILRSSMSSCSVPKWFPMNKGGAYRKWYGNNQWVINYENDGREIKDYAIQLYKCSSRTIQNTQFYFKEGITWSALTSGALSFRWSRPGAIFGSGAHCAFADDTRVMEYGLGLMNSKVNDLYLSILSPTLNTNVDDVRATPFLLEKTETVRQYVRNCIQCSANDWDAFETSWDFRRHPLIMPVELVQKAYISWEDEAQHRFEQLKANEEELNRLFIDIYGLQDELTPEVEEKDVTVRRADRGREVRSLISYAVGCMFGRYSLDEEGLIYAGGEWNPARYTTFAADADNIIPISDDEYFGDDIVKRFCEFIATVYGEAHLEENLQFIAESLGGGAADASRDVLRRYFLKDFYADHCKIYQKRPIYWLFDSGKKNGFKALMYIHRYDRDTLARLRTDYVHRQQDRYRTAISHLEEALPDLNGSEKVRKTADLQRKRAQLEEISAYEETLQHLADRHMSMELDDGVKHNYTLFPGLLAKIK